MNKNKDLQLNLYKKINIELPRSLTLEETNIIKNLEKLFPSNNFYFLKTEKNLFFNLKEIDLQLFENRLNEIMVKYSVDPFNNIFTQILNNIKQIKSYGVKGNKRIYIDYNKERKVKNRQKKSEERGIFYYAKNNNFSKQNNSFPDKFVNQIICGDSIKILKELPDNCIDLVFTSPPYNFGLDYENHKDEIDWNIYFEQLFIIFKECIRVVKYGGRIIINVQPLFSDYIPIHHIISNFFMENKMIWRGEILWEKNNYNCKYTAWGSWKSPSNPYMKYTWEFLEIFCKGDLKHFGNNSNSDITGDEFKKWVYAKWSIAPEKNMKNYNHPAMFPEKLVEQTLKLFSFENDVILDPFGGVGTTAKVAKQLNRKYISIDISQEYTNKAEIRLKDIY